MIQIKNELYSVAFLSLIVLTGCNQAETKEADSGIQKTDSAGTVKSGCTQVCKMPSRKTIANTTYSGGKDDAVMVLIKGGTFSMGSSEFSDSKPVHDVKIRDFYIDEHEVTNSQFARFVEQTGYKTVAERELDPADFPGVPKDKLLPGSAVFSSPSHKVNLNDYMQWWSYVPGADWKHPEGPQSSIKGRENHPVVQVCYEDALAYANWAGKRLPTEAEWEYAARSGKTGNSYYWGSDLKPNGKWVANIFQGNFPDNNTQEDGYAATAPVKSFPANNYKLFDMDGNVWEWCNDFYRPDYYEKSAKENPPGPTDSFDPEEPGVEKHVQRGGSFICSDQYCIRYKAGSRGKGETGSAGNNLGFRCVKTL